MNQLLRMRSIIFAMMDHLTAHARHYVLLTMDQGLRMRGFIFCHYGSSYCSWAT
jgi:hypothetical protein